MRPANFDLSMMSRPALVLALGVLAGCGGGGGDSTPPPPVVSVTAAPALEADGRIVFAVSLDGPSPRGITLSYATADLGTNLAAKAVPGYARGGSACAAGIDYVTAAGNLPIAVNGSGGTINITTCNDSIQQANKRFNLTVLGGAGPVVTAATVVNDDMNVAGALNDTGIVSCVDGAGAVVACPSAALPGQDAQTGRDAIAVVNQAADGLAGFSYSKVGAAGEALAAGAATWSCVRDGVTGLLWQVEPAVSVPAIYPYAGLQARVAAANTASLCGVATWRIPEVAELSSLINSGKTTGVALDSGWFADTAALANQQAALYWSATTYPTDTTTAWVVDFSTGTIGVKPKLGNNLSLRLVSGTASSASSATPCTVASAANAPADRFVDNADGTVTDKTTQLMWMQCSQGLSGPNCLTGSAASVSWSGALAAAVAVNGSAATLGKGYADWRVPNRNELGSLVERTCRAPAINSAYFPGTVLASYWSGSPALTVTKTAWQLNFVDGDVGPGDTVGNRNLRLVRAGN